MDKELIADPLMDLRLREKGLVESIRRKLKKKDPDCKVVYLPNPEPRERTEYVLITMEPSFGRWARDEKEAERKVQDGFRNFLLTWEDFIFHYCIREYLSSSYYITDVSKAAMRVGDANRHRKWIYPQWYDLLQEEISTVGKDDCKIILVGQKVDRFLRNKPLSPRIVRTIPHYSGQAARERNAYVKSHSDEFEDFQMNTHLSSEVILKYAEAKLREDEIPDNIGSSILKGLRSSKTKLSDSRRKLMFIYCREFRQILKS